RVLVLFFFSSRRRHTRWPRDWSSDVCSSDLVSVDMTSGELLIWTTPYTPFFGADDLGAARTVGEMTLLALDRARLFSSGGSGGEIGRASCREGGWVAACGVRARRQTDRRQRS